MKLYKKTLFLLIVLVASLCFLPGTSLAKRADILSFEPGDTIEEIRAKIKHNGYDFTVDHNWVFDMPAQEKQKFFSRKASLFPRVAATYDGIGPLARHLEKRQLPSSFDWRNYNGHSYIGPVRDQGNCGSCYAFGACAAAEGTYNWAYGKYDGNCADFSEAFVAFCLSDYYSGFDGCDGTDYDYQELTGLVDYGVCNEDVYPYAGHEQECQSSSWDAPRTTFQSWHRIDCNDIEAIKTAIMTYGVIDAAVDAGDAFLAYSEGVYEDSNTSCDSNPCYYTPTNHAIALVGWDDNGGDGYWILRNSWGTAWGENGYMRIKYTSALVACEATYLYLESPTGLTTSPSGGFSSEGRSGGSFSPAGIVYTLENRNDTGINYSVSKGKSWVLISDTGGYLAGHATTDVTVSINSNANSLSNGTYTDTVTFTNATDHDGDTTRGVTLVVGIPSLQYSWNMDTEPGWTTQGLWSWGQPAGGGGQYGGPDPGSGYTGNNVYGYNLSGNYEKYLSEKHLTSTAINCTDMSRVTLKFRRWLGVEQPFYDHAYIRVSNDGSTWTTVWENSTEIADTSWSLQEFDISSVADGQSTVYLRWTMGSTDDSWQYCGWNIDDVEIWAMQATDTSPEVLYFPYLISTDEEETRAGIINTENYTVTSFISYYGKDGDLITTTDMTLKPKGKTTIYPDSIPSDSASAIISADGNLAGYTRYVNTQGQRCAWPANIQPQDSIPVPHTAADSNWATALCLFNPNNEDVEVTLDYDTGTSGNLTLNLKSQAFFYLNESEPVSSISATGYITAMEMFDSLTSGGDRAALLLKKRYLNALYVPCISYGAEEFTGVGLINGYRDGTISVFGHNETGEVEKVPLGSLSAQTRITADISGILRDDKVWAQIYGEADFIGPFGRSSMLFDGLAAYGEDNTGKLGAVNLNALRFKEGFIGIISTDPESTFALLNPDTADAALSVTGYNSDGEVLASNTIQIKAGNNLTGTVSDLLNGASLTDVTHIRIVSDVNIYGSETIYTGDRMEMLPVLAVE